MTGSAAPHIKYRCYLQTAIPAFFNLANGGCVCGAWCTVPVELVLIIAVK